MPSGTEYINTSVFASGFQVGTHSAPLQPYAGAASQAQSRGEIASEAQTGLSRTMVPGLTANSGSSPTPTPAEVTSGKQAPTQTGPASKILTGYSAAGKLGIGSEAKVSRAATTADSRAASSNRNLPVDRCGVPFGDRRDWQRCRWIKRL